MKKIFNAKKSSLCLLCLLLALFSFQIVYAGGEGTCDVTKDNGVLTIKPPDDSSDDTCTLESNDGDDFTFYDWANNSDITKVIIGEGVKTGEGANYMFYNLYSVTTWVGLANLDVSGSSTLLGIIVEVWTI